MQLNQGPLLYEGKAKKVYRSDKPETVLIEFKNDATAFNAVKHSEFKDKGRLNCQISSYIFEFLIEEGIPTHYLGRLSDTFMIAQNVKIIPLEIVVRNIAAGSLCKQTPIKEGVKLRSPLLDIYYKEDSLGDPLLTDKRLKLLDLISFEQQQEIENLAYEVNTFLIAFFERIDLCLVDFKLEFGMNNNNKIILADEISPDTCRLWDNRSSDPKDRILDKDRFRKDLGGVIEAYGEILKRIQGDFSKSKTSR